MLPEELFKVVEKELSLLLKPRKENLESTLKENFDLSKQSSIGK